MKRNDPILRAVRTTICKHGWLSVGLLVSIAGAIIVGVLPPLLLERLINQLEAGSSALLGLALGYFAVTAAAGLLDMGKECLVTGLGQKLTHAIRTEMAAKLNALPAEYYVSHDPGATVSRLVGDVDTVETLFTSGVISMAVDFCKIISIFWVILARSPGLGILLILLIPLLFALTRTFQKRMLLAQLDQRAAAARTNQQIPETLSNLRTVRTLNRETYMEQRYGDAIEQGFRAMEKSIFYDAAYSPIIITVSAALVGIMMVLSAQGGAFQAFFGMRVGTAVAIIAYVGKIFGPLESIGMEIQNIQSAVAGVRRIREFLEEPEFDPPGEMPGFDESAPAVQIENLSFAYGDDREIFRDFSMAVAQGETVTLAGRTGAGKSTLFKLLLGLYPPQSGEVRILGVPAGQIPPEEKRRVFGYVEQQFCAVPGSLGEQISLRDKNVTADEIVAALRTVGLWDAVCGLPDGVSTPFSPALFSQGQLQLLSIARAIVRNPRILLLDEITANLDAGTEAQVMAALRMAAKNRTVISISHRLYEQNGGRIVSIGL